MGFRAARVVSPSCRFVNKVSVARLRTVKDFGSYCGSESFCMLSAACAFSIASFGSTRKIESVCRLLFGEGSNERRKEIDNVSNLKGAVQKLGGRLQKTVLVALMVLILVLPTGPVAAMDGLPCGSGCRTITLRR